MAVQAEKQEKTSERTPTLAQLFVPLLLAARYRKEEIQQSG